MTNVSRPSTSPVVVALIGCALAGIVGLNIMSSRITPKTDAQLQAEAREREKASQPSATPTVPSAAPTAAAADSGSANTQNALVRLGESSVLGSADAKQEVVVGFSWTPEVQSDPSKVSVAVDTLQKAVGDRARIKVVNTDELPATPEGISINGRLVVPAQADGAITPSAVGAVTQALSASQTR
ncbi:MAG: hypothetical protein H7Z41_18240 [Cytophagales bacterium]|nr:hypothetical protein [Armatimonadota bacterium]